MEWNGLNPVAAIDPLIFYSFDATINLHTQHLQQTPMTVFA
jgi:hypothetical protein